MKTRSPSPASSLTPIPVAAPALRRPRLTRRQAAQERARQDATRPGRFDPRKYALPARPKPEKAAAPAADAAAAPDAATDITEAAAALPRTPPLVRLPVRPLVLSRPLVRAGGEDYRQHPSRLTPQQREAYWLAPAPLQPLAAPRQAREE